MARMRRRGIDFAGGTHSVTALTSISSLGIRDAEPGKTKRYIELPRSSSARHGSEQGSRFHKLIIAGKSSPWTRLIKDLSLK